MSQDITEPNPITPSCAPLHPFWAETLWKAISREWGKTAVEEEIEKARQKPQNAIELAFSQARVSLVGCQRDVLMGLLGRLSLHCPPRQMSEGQSKIYLEDYAADLAFIPETVVKHVCDEWRRTQQWFPKVSEFLAAAGPHVAALIRYKEALARAKEPAPTPIPEPPPDPEHEARIQAEIRSMIDGMVSRSKARKAAERQILSEIWTRSCPPDTAEETKRLLDEVERRNLTGKASKGWTEQEGEGE